MRAIPIQELNGMTPILESVLHALGIYDTQQFLAATRTHIAREALAIEARVPRRVILQLAHRADLSRIWGMPGPCADLLEQVGVTSVRELAAWDPNNLHAEMVRANNQREMADCLPSPDQIADWHRQAWEMPGSLTHGNSVPLYGSSCTGSLIWLGQEDGPAGILHRRYPRTDNSPHTSGSAQHGSTLVHDIMRER